MTLEWRNGRIVLPDLLVLRAKEEPMQFKGHVLDGDEQQRLGKALLLRREELDEEDLDAVFPEDQSDAIEKLSLVWEAYGSEYLFVGYSADGQSFRGWYHIPKEPQYPKRMVSLERLSRDPNQLGRVDEFIWP